MSSGCNSQNEIYAVCSRLLETETLCPMCSEALSISQVKKISDCSRYLQSNKLDE